MKTQVCPLKMQEQSKVSGSWACLPPQCWESPHSPWPTAVAWAREGERGFLPEKQYVQQSSANKEACAPMHCHAFLCTLHFRHKFLLIVFVETNRNKPLPTLSYVTPSSWSMHPITTFQIKQHVVKLKYQLFTIAKINPSNNYQQEGKQVVIYPYRYYSIIIAIKRWSMRQHKKTWKQANQKATWYKMLGTGNVWIRQTRVRKKLGD